ncbi:FMN-binding protein [Microbacterium hominis]|uniref:FMN-binding protein n=1 Tax=Microbacterium hominis TaxID=162426 RepID=UPI00077C1DE0|nr:FMN-binding protein [Microbacterium hominis]
MKKIVYAILATLSGLVLLFSYRTSLPEDQASASASAATDTATAAARTATAPTATTPTTTPRATASAAAATPSATASSGTGLADGTYTGAAADTRYGAVQVQITVAGGVITDVQTPQYPSSNGRDRQINQNALPRLISETMAAQSAAIDMVSGATYTSDGYIASLQSAIDQAAA